MVGNDKQFPDEIIKLRSNLETSTYATLDLKCRRMNRINEVIARNQNRMNSTRLNDEIVKNPTIGLTAKNLMTAELIVSMFNMFNIMSARLTELEKGDGRQGE